MNKIYNKLFDETYYKEILDNGLTVTIISKPDFLTTTACFATPYGSLNVNQKIDNIKKRYNPGIAHFLEHKLFENEGKDVLSQFSELGANVNAFTSYRETVYYFSKTGDDIETSLNLLLDFVQELDITFESVEKEKGIIIEELSMYLQNPDIQLVNETYKSLYSYYPLKFDIGGDADSIKKISKEELEDCYNLNYHPSNMQLVIVSPIDPEKLLNIIKNNQNKKNFLKQNRPIADNSIEPLEVFRKEHTLSMDVTKGKTCYAIKINPDFKDNLDAHKKELAVTMYLNCYFSPINPNYQKWLDENLINDFFGFEVSFNSEAANILFYMESDNKDVLKQLIDDELKNDLVNDEIIEQIKRRMLGASFKVFNDIEDFATGYIRDLINDVDYFEVINNIKNINATQIKSIFKSLDLSNYSIVHISKRK